MVKKIKRLILTLLLGGCLFLSACGQKETVEPSSEDPSPSPAPLQWEDIWNSDGTLDRDKYNQYFGIEVPEADTSKELPENVILLGALARDYELIHRQVNTFNEAQSDYKVEIQRYENRADLFDAVLEVGTVGETLAGIMPGFNVDVILVEKGYTKGGGWTIAEYLALMDKYPDVRLTSSVSPQFYVAWILNELSALPESFVNWEERTCSFESESFIQTIEMLKSYAERCQKSKTDSTSTQTTLADRLYQKQVQTMSITLSFGGYFSSYRDIKDAFLQSYELAGIPNMDGEVRYPITDSMNGTVLYSMNAASDKKDGAWLFLEYLLSEYQETMRSEGFPARRDLVERLLQEEVEAEVTENSLSQNLYTREMVPMRGSFTEEDKEHVLYILDHAVPPTALQAGGTFRTILMEELNAFLMGDKTAAETAHILQNRMTTYLSE